LLAVEPVVLELVDFFECFLFVLALLVLVVVFWSGAGWVAGLSCANVNGSVAAAKMIPSKLFFMFLFS
jgi:hypothetical protein